MMKCDTCKAEKETKPNKKGGQKLPKGWKVLQGQTLCNKCKGSRYALRAVTFPIVGPADPKDWPAFRAALKEGWSQITSLSNFIDSEIAKRDIVRTPDMDKMPPLGGKDIYCYPLARERFPDIDSGIVATVENQVKSKYLKRRYSVVWLSEATRPNYRYPQPYPIRKTDWAASYDNDKRPHIEAKIAGTWFKLRLRGGANYKRQLAAFARLIKGEAEPAELAIYRIRANDSDHRNGAEEKGTQYRIMAKLCLWLPKPPERERAGKMVIKTEADSFLVASVEGRENPFTLNADHVRRWQAQHARRRARISEDTKYEKRWPKEIRDRMLNQQSVWVTKYRNRINSFCHEASACFVNHAARQGIKTVVYDDAYKEYLPQFPWEQLRQLIKQKCDYNSIEFVWANEPQKKVFKKANKAAAEAPPEIREILGL